MAVARRQTNFDIFALRDFIHGECQCFRPWWAHLNGEQEITTSG